MDEYEVNASLARGKHKHITEGATWIIRGIENGDVAQIGNFFGQAVPDWFVDESYIKAFVRMFPGSGLVATKKSDDTVCGTIFITPQDDVTAYLSLVVVSPDMRNRGIATGLFEIGVRLAGERNILLESMTASTSYYQNNSFKQTGVWWTTVCGRRRVESDINIEIKSQETSGVSVKEATVDSVIEYDRHIFPSGRDWFIKEFVFEHPALNIKIATQNDMVVGYGFVREISNNYFLTLYGDRINVAEMLLKEILQYIPAGSVTNIVIRKSNPDAVNLVEKIIEIDFQYDTMTMVAGSEASLGWNKTFFRNYCDFPSI